MSLYKLLHSSIGVKILMALTGFFLMIFLFVHLCVNLSLFFGEKAFNRAALFMESNPFVQISQYMLAFFFILHILLGILLHLKNRKARGNVNYTKWEANTPFNARTMIFSGILILLFLILHLKNFTIPLKNDKYGKINNYQFVISLFKNPVYTFIYILSFVILSLHLSHGFQSSFRSVGIFQKSYISTIKKIGFIYFWLISLGFSSIALWFFFRT
ncbi:MAG TPA: succinate dehydrogenase cytochrome b subunit [Candidatus Angelobacter sp.]|jgi:succinate dehydrogenase / fumarate reductase cytochrome b subunit|nr:succinate dehydrogenase cytochrome b subunit [Candidatus Angelobacter sp.]